MDIEWTKGDKPKEQGVYIIAAEYDNGMGFFNAAYWNPVDGWDIQKGEKVVAFIPLRKITINLPYPWDDNE